MMDAVSRRLCCSTERPPCKEVPLQPPLSGHRLRRAHLIVPTGILPLSWATITEMRNRFQKPDNAHSARVCVGSF